jgi:hypothetical protein
VIDPYDVQAHIAGFWSTIAADYEAHAGNVAEHGSVEYQRWVDALASVLPDPPGEVPDAVLPHAPGVSVGSAGPRVCVPVIEAGKVVRLI